MSHKVKRTAATAFLFSSCIYVVAAIKVYRIFLLQADDEVPIWICGEPRFISGVTSTTTCNEIIQALIDDELNNVGNGKLHLFSTYAYLLESWDSPNAV